MVRIETDDIDLTFIHLAKNAGTSIEIWLQKHIPEAEVYGSESDMGYERPSVVNPLFDSLGWTFCVVRNPWDRLVSVWSFWVRSNSINYSFDEWFKLCQDNRTITRKYTRFPNPQLTHYLECDTVLRFENLVEDFKIVQDKVKCWEPLGKLNHSHHKHYTEYFSKEQREYTANYFWKDIKDFNYKFGD